MADQLVKMASDTEDAVSSAALISSIRDKIVEYKEFLLRYVVVTFQLAVDAAEWLFSNAVVVVFCCFTNFADS